MSATWTCTGHPPHEPPCGESGTTQASAERHVAATNHATCFATTAGMLARLGAGGAE